MPQPTKQTQAQKQAVARRLADLHESTLKPQKMPARARRWEKAPDLRDSKFSDATAVHLARAATERVLRLSSRQSIEASCLMLGVGAIIVDPEFTLEALEKPARRMTRAKRLLLRLVTAYTLRALVGEQVVIGRNRKKPRKPHWKKRTLL